MTHATDVGNGFSDSPENQLQRAEDAARRALALDPNNALAHHAMGIVHMLRTRFDLTAQEENFEAAILEYEAALAANPNFSHPRLLIAYCLNSLGRFEEALAITREGMRVSPRDPQLNQFHMAAVEASLGLGRSEEAVEWARRAVAAHREHVWGHVYLASAYALDGQLPEARKALAKADALRPGITIADFERDWFGPKVNTASAALQQRMKDGLRKAGMPEGQPAPAN